LLFEFDKIFEILKNKIISEWLYEKRINKFYEIFERTENNIKVKDNKNKLLGLANIDERSLFLNVSLSIFITLFLLTIRNTAIN